MRVVHRPLLGRLRARGRVFEERRPLVLELHDGGVVARGVGAFDQREVEAGAIVVGDDDLPVGEDFERRLLERLQHLDALLVFLVE
ncbi:MAG: hypothetical protein ACXW31_11960 [Thermoanaerobaculia bacterium]